MAKDARPHTENVSVRGANENDVAAIQNVASQSWQATYANIYPKAYVASFLWNAYSTANLTRSINDQSSIFLVATNGREVVGFCHWGIGERGAELFRIYLLPSIWRGGIGGELIDALEQRLRERGVATYGCYVHAQNRAAQSFYARMGFVHDAASDREDEWWMHRERRAQTA